MPREVKGRKGGSKKEGRGAEREEKIHAQNCKEKVTKRNGFARMGWFVKRGERI